MTEPRPVDPAPSNPEPTEPTQAEPEPPDPLPMPTAPSPCTGASTPRRVLETKDELTLFAVQGKMLATWSRPAATSMRMTLTLFDMATGDRREVDTYGLDPRSLSLTETDAFWGSAYDFVGSRLDRYGLNHALKPQTVWQGKDAIWTDTVATPEWLFYLRDESELVRVDSAGNETVLLEDTFANDLQTDGSELYFSQCGDGGGIWRVKTTGGAQLIASTDCADAFATDGKDVYYSAFTGFGGGGLTEQYRVPVNGGGGAERLTESVDGVFVMKMDARSVYMATSGGQLYRRDRASKKISLLTAGNAADLAIDEQCLYWNDPAAHAVYTLEKPR